MMVLLILAANAATVPERAPSARAVVEAKATVRIISAVQLKLDSPVNPKAPLAHDSKVTADGKVQPARLIEFE
ncbi:MAG TPA: hypothetical protein VE820_01850 [Sphingomicrobium sp.]|jgi:hypothetical protein|nr:hypothetical protein [Sphingomicrobium sp.]